ncbi:MAG: class III poly(R)-hydroxyalkanoic acid synthase subunit PhaC [Myxococcota bacterium]|nr:class III poly(R)-hydroxyalkanoic acid synthase subunit PhaC [Myxococcota bacterium]
MVAVNSADQFSELLTNRLVSFQEQLLKGTKVLTGPLDTTTGATPKDEVLAVDRWKLYRYRPVVQHPAPIPVIIFYALVNRYYMVDIQPDRSMVRKFLEAGLDVYVLDWGHPYRGDRFLTMEDYIDGYMNQAVDFVRRTSNQDAVTLYGICQGGTFSTIYTALYPEKVKNLAIMVTPIDFHTDTGLLNVWSKFLDVDRMVNTFGNVPGDFMNVGFLLLNPLRLMFQKYVDFVDHMDDKNFVSNFVRMEKWIFDSPDQAGEAFLQFIKCMYQENQLVKGAFHLGGRRVDLKHIKQPVLNVFGEKDHLVPPACSRPFNDLVGSKDKTILSYPTGHIGLFTSGKSQTEYAPAIAKWLSDHCQSNGAMTRAKIEAPMTATETAVPRKTTGTKATTKKRGRKKTGGAR